MEPRSPHIFDELKALQSSLAEMPVAMPFAVPGGSFRDFPGQVQLRILIEEGGMDMADPVPVFDTLQVPFAVPAGYFAQFAEALKEVLEVASLEARLPRANVFAVPEGYFDSLSETLMTAVQERAAFPENLSKKPPFEVPAGYFDQFAQSLQARLKAEELSLIHI